MLSSVNGTKRTPSIEAHKLRRQVPKDARLASVKLRDRALGRDPHNAVGDDPKEIVGTLPGDQALIIGEGPGSIALAFTRERRAEGIVHHLTLQPGDAPIALDGIMAFRALFFAEGVEVRAILPTPKEHWRSVTQGGAPPAIHLFAVEEKSRLVLS